LKTLLSVVNIRRLLTCSARTEDPLGKVIFFTKLAEVVPAESEVYWRSDL